MFKPWKFTALAFGSVLLIVTGVSSSVAQDLPPNSASEQQSQPTDWREEYAYTLGTQAYIFGYPWVYLAKIRYGWVTQPRNPKAIPYAPLNYFWHIQNLVDASYRDGGSPNQDTLYSTAWVDLSKGPVILSHPDLGDRFFTFEIADMSSDNFAVVGQNTTGSKAGNFAIVGPDWNGTLPEGVKKLPPATNNSVLILGRTLVKGKADVATAHGFMSQYKLTPLALWGKPEAKVPEDRNVFAPSDATTDPLGDWKTMNKNMTENPPEPRHAALVKLFATIGVGPGQNLDALDEPTKRGLQRAAIEGKRILVASLDNPKFKTVNGWKYPPPQMGRAGNVDDFLLRAANQCMWGIISQDPPEATYLSIRSDAKGERLNGANRYTIHYPPGGLPEVKAFWSITLYDDTNNFVDNRLDRYSLGDRSAQMKSDPDGGLTLYVQADTPGGDKEGNWLPAPKNTPFALTLRTYIPGKTIVDQTWMPPPVVMQAK